MKNLTKILWGIAFIAVGVIFALNACGLTNINVFFEGWWTLFIIVPCFIGLFSTNGKTASVIGLVIGVFFLLCCQGWLGFDMVWKLLFPIIIVIIGLRILFGAIFGHKAPKASKKAPKNSGNVKSACAVFAGQDINFAGEVFDGAEFTAVFGGIDCDLTGAIIEHDCTIDATGIFGGIDIIVPYNVNVKVNSNSIFGGVSNKNHRADIEGAVTLYINATCMFGGVEIK